MRKLIAAVAAALAINVQAATPVINQWGKTESIRDIDLGFGFPMVVKFVDGTLADVYGQDTVDAIREHTMRVGVWSHDLLSLVNAHGAVWLSHNVHWPSSWYIHGCDNYCTIISFDKAGRFDYEGTSVIIASWTVINKNGVNRFVNQFDGFAAWSSLDATTYGINRTIAVWSAQ